MANQNQNDMPQEIYLNGLTVDQLLSLIKESVHEELSYYKSTPNKADVKYFTRKETARRLKISLVTLTDWVNKNKIQAHKIGGRVLFRGCEVDQALREIVPIKRKRR